MNQKTALETLIHLDNRRTYCVSVNEWHNTYSFGSKPQSRTEVNITVFPLSAFGKVELFAGSNLSEVMAQAVAFIKPELPTS